MIQNLVFTETKISDFPEFVTTQFFPTCYSRPNEIKHASYICIMEGIQCVPLMINSHSLIVSVMNDGSFMTTFSCCLEFEIFLKHRCETVPLEKSCLFYKLVIVLWNVVKAEHNAYVVACKTNEMSYTCSTFIWAKFNIFFLKFSTKHMYFLNE